MAFGRIVLGGTLGGSQRWSIGLNLSVADTSVPTPAQMTTFAEAVRALFDADVWSGTPSYKAMVGTAGNFDVCHAYYAPQSSPPPPFTVSGDSTGAAVAGTGSRSMPAQSALVVTLLTDVAGRHGRGRSYLPLGIGTFTSGTLVLTNAYGPLATGFAAFLTAVNGTSMGSNSVAVVIRTNSPSFPFGIAVKRLKIDNVPDTQRRRRDKVASTVTVTGTV